MRQTFRLKKRFCFAEIQSNETLIATTDKAKEKMRAIDKFDLSKVDDNSNNRIEILSGRAYKLSLPIL